MLSTVLPTSLSTSTRARLGLVGTSAAVVAVLGLTLSACGQQSGSASSAGGADSDPSGSASASTVGQCDATSAAVTDAPTVASADLDGDGTADDVSLTSADATGCGSYLVATVGGKPVGAALGEGVTPSKYQTITIPGRSGNVLVVESTHPRGGTQALLFGYAEGKLGQIVDGTGNSPIPFVSTDTVGGSGGLYSVRCTQDVPNGLVVQKAVAHDPAGVAAAFDIQERTYSIEGLTASSGPIKEVADNVLPDQLQQRFPDLATTASFNGC